MGQELLSLFPLETKRLLWFIGITFAVILAFQYLELPYGNVLLSLNQANSLEMANKTRMSGEKETTPRTGFVLQPGSPPKKSLGFHESPKSSMVDSIKRSGNISNTQQPGDFGPNSYNNTMGLSFLTNGSPEENITSRSEHESGSPFAYSPYYPSPEKAPTHLTPPFTPTTYVSPNITIAVLSNDYNITLSQKDNRTHSMKEGSFRPSQNDGNVMGKNSTFNTGPKEKQDSFTRIPEVTSVSEMNKLLLKSHASYRSMRARWFSDVDQELLQARSEIENAATLKNDPNLYASIYQNVSMFKRAKSTIENLCRDFVQQ